MEVKQLRNNRVGDRRQTTKKYLLGASRVTDTDRDHNFYESKYAPRARGQIDALVYNLYEPAPVEIVLVENA